MDAASLRDQYDTLKVEAETLAGDAHDFKRRATLLAGLYLDSGGNHTFSQIAAHGALWAVGYFDRGGSLGRLVARRYFYNPSEMAYRLELLEGFATAFRLVNRLVFIDTYTNYMFTRQFGCDAAASEILPAGLLEALNRVHAARSSGHVLNARERREVFEQSFRCEQEVTVAPGVVKAVAGFDCPILRFLCLRPLVRFHYFPKLRYLFFRNFGETEERIEKGMLAYDLAERAGWSRVHASLRRYRRLPDRFFDDPSSCIRETRSEASALQSSVAVTRKSSIPACAPSARPVSKGFCSDR